MALSWVAPMAVPYGMGAGVAQVMVAGWAEPEEAELLLFPQPVRQMRAAKTAVARAALKIEIGAKDLTESICGGPA